MTTVADKDILLRWDYFLDEMGLTPGGGEAARTMIAAWRLSEWPTIKRDLARQFRWEIPDDLDPHWVAPGRAVYWCHEITSRPVPVLVGGEPETIDGQLTGRREWKDFDNGWNPTKGLPANNPTQIAHYLDKGFRLRPPQEGVEMETLKESAEASDDLQGDTSDTRPTYACYKHAKGKLVWRTWKAYIQHCLSKKEAPEYDLPPEVAERAKKFPFYCAIHDRGFTHPAHAGRHLAAELKKAGKAVHPSMDDMRIQTAVKV